MCESASNPAAHIPLPTPRGSNTRGSHTRRRAAPRGAHGRTARPGQEAVPPPLGRLHKRAPAGFVQKA